jgi:hypothetical protein
VPKDGYADIHLEQHIACQRPPTLSKAVYVHSINDPSAFSLPWLPCPYSWLAGTPRLARFGPNYSYYLDLAIIDTGLGSINTCRTTPDSQ